MRFSISLGSISLFIVMMVASVMGFRSGLRAMKGGQVLLRMASGSPAPAAIKDMLPKELAAILKSDARDLYQIVDVRESNELEMVALPDKKVIHLPLSTANTWTQEIAEGKILDSSKPTVCVCHHGMRSKRMAMFLTGQAQFIDVYNLQGGIHSFALEADPTIEDKYQGVIEALEERGWQRAESEDSSRIIWTNLKAQSKKPQAAAAELVEDSDHKSNKVAYNVIKNHFQGAQHFSNKALLVYHLVASQSSINYPRTWSPAVHSAYDLVMLLLHTSLLTLESDPDQANVAYNKYKAAYDNLKLKCGKSISASISSQQKALSLAKDSEVERLLSTYLLRGEAFPTEKKIKSIENVWIVKPTALSCGENIHIVKGMEEALQCVNKFDHKCIVQKYIESPMLIAGHRKFDIRQWVLITSIDPLVVYGFSECYIRLSSKPYSLNNLTDPLLHLCNHSIQKQGQSEVEAEAEGGSTCHTMLRLADFRREVSEFVIEHHLSCANPSTAYEDLLLPQIKETVIQSIYSIRDMLSSGRERQEFEWLGFDLMVEHEEGQGLKVQLIEINTSPDISYSTSITTPLVKAACRDLFTLVLDEHTRVDSNNVPRKSDLQLGSKVDGDNALRWLCWHIEDSAQTLTPAQAARRKQTVARMKKDYNLVDREILADTLNILQNKQTKVSGTIEVEDDDEL